MTPLRTPRRGGSKLAVLATLMALVAAACGGEVAGLADELEAQQSGFNANAPGEGDFGGGDVVGTDSTGTGTGTATRSGRSGGSGGGATGTGTASGDGTSTEAAPTKFSTVNEPGISDDAISFCSVLPLTGPLGFIGKPQISAIDSYFKMVNEQGGVHGRKIKWKYYDDGFDPARGVSQVKKCAEEDKAWALGPGWNAFTVSASIGYLEQKKMPWFFSDGATTDQYKTDVVFPYGVLCDRLSQDITDRVIVDRGAKRLGIIYINNDIGQLCNDASKQVADALGAQIVETAAVNADEADYTPVILRMRAAEVDAIIIHGGPTETVKALQAGERQSFNPPKGWACSGGCALDVTLEFIGRFSDNLLSNSPLREAGATPEGQRMIATVKKYHPNETDFGVFTNAGWMFAKMLVDALEEAGPEVSRQKLADTLRSHPWENGLGEPANFNPPRPGTRYLPLLAKNQHWEEAGPLRDIGEKYPGLAVP